jgi:CRP-like cAMP-binding protein
MKFKPLYEAINRRVEINDKEIGILNSYFTFRNIPKKHKLVEYCEKCNELYFINKGCLRMYYIKESGDEMTRFFFTERMFVTSLESFLTGMPGIQVIEALEDCELWVLKKTALKDCMN